MAKRSGATRKPSGSSARSSRRHRRSRAPGRRGLAEQLERTQAQRMADSGWIEWGGELIWAVGFTSGGAPYGLRVCDFDRADLEAMGLDVAALEDAGQLATTSSAPCSASTSSMSTGTMTSPTAESRIQESNGRLPDDDVPF